jgi:hypothetical protein
LGGFLQRNLYKLKIDVIKNMEEIKKQYPNPSDLNNLYGHTDLEGFSKYLGINYDTLLEINKKNAEVIRNSNTA